MGVTGSRDAFARAETRSRCLSVLVDQSAEQVVPVDAGRGRNAVDDVWIGAVCGGELQRAVRGCPL